MGLEICSFASGSSGNSYMVRSANTMLLVDVGTAGKNIISGLGKAGADIKDVDGILLTHEHEDHIKSIRMMGKKASHAYIYSTAGTLRAVEERLPAGRAKEISRREQFSVGDIIVSSFALSHDAADPVGYSFECGNKKLSIVTDTGIVTEEIYAAMKGSDALILEANHEVNILRMGPYPYSLKQRILGEYGHLSNEIAGNTIGEVLKSFKGNDMPRIMLAHLSKENNTPEQAFLTVRNMLFEKDYYVDKDLELTVAHRSVPSELIKL